MLSVPNYSIRDRVDELDLQTCSFLLVMSEPESLTAVVRTTATEAWESTETVRSGVAKGFRGVRSKIARQPVKTSEEFVEVDVTEDAEPDLGSPEEQAKKREEFERRLSEYQTKGLHECRKELVARLFTLAKQDIGSRNERPLLESALGGFKVKADDRIHDTDLQCLIYSRMIAELQQNTELTLARATDEERTNLLLKLDDELNNMAPAQVENMRQALGVDKLTGDILLKSALSAGAAGGFAAGVNAGGFAAYTAMSTVMHAVATTMLGVTLPFGVYTAASSFLSTASGGLLLLPLAGSWIFFNRRSRARENRTKLGMVVAAIVSATSQDHPATPTWLA
jgi:hypothetical protein